MYESFVFVYEIKGEEGEAVEVGTEDEWWFGVGDNCWELIIGII
jgi:hypothetical protein